MQQEQMNQLAAHWEQALKFHQQGAFEAAEQHYRAILAALPYHTDSLHYYGLLLHEHKQHEKALPLVKQALSLSPDDPELMSNFLSVVLALNEQKDEPSPEADLALAQAERLLLLRPDWVSGLKNVMKLFALEKQYARAQTLMETILQQIPDDVETHMLMADLASKQGDDERALVYARKTLALDRSQYRAFMILGAAHKFKTVWPEHEYYYQLLNDLPEGEKERTYMGFSLGKMYDDVGEYERAFECYKIANDNVEWRDEITRYRQRYQNVVQDYTEALTDSLAPGGSESEQPIFVLGMPRSGSTLVEQILSSHSQIAPGGERKEIYQGFAAQVNNDNHAWLTMEQHLKRLGPAAITDMTERFLGMIEREAPGCKHFVDKMPGNFMQIGLIRIMFPKARIIYTHRHPLDVMLSCYFQLFGEGNKYSYRWDSLVDYYNLHTRFMRLWMQRFDNILELRYDQMVSQPEVMTRKLIRFVGVDWEDACLQHHKENKRVPRTASHWQARQPIYTSSIDRWKRYEAQLAPYMDRIEDDVYFPRESTEEKAPG